MTNMFRKLKERIVSDRSTTLGGKKFMYTLVQSPAARTVRLKMSMQKGLELIVPGRFRPDHAEEIVADHEQWILKQLRKLEERKKLRDRHQLSDGSTLHILDQPHTVKFISGHKKKPLVKRVQKLAFSEDTAIVTGHELHVYCDGSIKEAKETLENYLRRVAEKYFAKRAFMLAEEMNVTFKNITIRAQKTRWGSCSREKNLNFNWRLILLQKPVADSVIVHELAHTVFMNHSKAFYGFVERFCPDYRRLQKHLHNPQFLV